MPAHDLPLFCPSILSTTCRAQVNAEYQNTGLLSGSETRISLSACFLKKKRKEKENVQIFPSISL